jgi:hypothetical protein
MKTKDFTGITTFLKASNDFMDAFPKTEADMKKTLEKLKSIFEIETENSKSMWEIFAKYARGEASINEINSANETATSLLKTAGFVSAFMMPGALFVLPGLISMAKINGIDVVPASIKKEFNI